MLYFYTRVSVNDTYTPAYNISVCNDNYNRMAPGIKNEKLSETETIIAISLPTWEQVLEWFRNKGFIGTVEYKDFYSENNYEYAFCIINKLDKKNLSFYW